MLNILIYYTLYLFVSVVYLYSILVLIAALAMYFPQLRSLWSLIARIGDWCYPQFVWFGNLLPENLRKGAPVLYWLCWYLAVKILQWLVHLLPKVRF